MRNYARNDLRVNTIVEQIKDWEKYDEELLSHLVYELGRIGWNMEKKKPNESDEFRVKCKWERATFTLYLGETVCRRFRREAKNQMALLDIFEKWRWPRSIPREALPDCLHGQALADAVARMNKYQSELNFSFNHANIFVFRRLL